MTKIICKSCKAINPGLFFRCHNCNHDLDAGEPKVVKNVFVEADYMDGVHIKTTPTEIKDRYDQKIETIRRVSSLINRIEDQVMELTRYYDLPGVALVIRELENLRRSLQNGKYSV